MCVCLWAYVLHSVPRGSCFQMTPSSELSPDICISLRHTRTHTRVCPLTRVHTSVVASFLLGWDSVTSIWGLAVSHTHWQSLTTNHRRWTDRCKCVWVLVADVNDERWSRFATVPPKSRPMTPHQRTHACKTWCNRDETGGCFVEFGCRRCVGEVWIVSGNQSIKTHYRIKHTLKL